MIFKSIIYILLAINTYAFTRISKFDIIFNKNYISGVTNLLNLNEHLNNKTSEIIINKYNKKSIAYDFKFDKNIKSRFLLKNKYNYLIKQDFIYNDLKTYEYLIYIKSLPISFNETIWNITLKHNIDYIQSHFIDAMIREWLINHIKRESTELNTELFKFFYG